MTRQFLIAGMPRCRTAWLSVATTTAKSICYHEPTATTDSFEQLAEMWKPSFGQIIGMSDSALSLQLDRILDVLNPRTLLIERPIPQVTMSLRKYLNGSKVAFDYDLGVKYLGKMQEKIDQFRHHPSVRTVKFDELRNYDTVLNLLKWLVPGEEFCDLKSLMTMNIQADRDYVLGLLEKPHTHWYRQDAALYQNL